MIPHEYCADIIATYKSNLVAIERLKFPQGLALPGGRRDIINGVLEDAVTCAQREFTEETGLTLTTQGYLGRYDTPGRDPRGPKTSDVYFGVAEGTLRNEAGKTRVVLIPWTDVAKQREAFVFDHSDVLRDYLERKQ